MEQNPLVHLVRPDGMRPLLRNRVPEDGRCHKGVIACETVIWQEGRFWHAYSSNRSEPRVNACRGSLPRMWQLRPPKSITECQARANAAPLRASLALTAGGRIGSPQKRAIGMLPLASKNQYEYKAFLKRRTGFRPWLRGPRSAKMALNEMSSHPVTIGRGHRCYGRRTVEPVDLPASKSRCA